MKKFNYKKFIRTASLIVLFLSFFLAGLLVGIYLEKRKVAPLNVNLGGLDRSIIQVDELYSKIKWGKEIYLYDLRSREQYDGGHIKKAVSMPENELLGKLSEIPREKEVVIYCQNYSCEEAGQATMILDAAGYKNFRTLFGGIEEWTNQNHKLTK